LHEKLPVIKSDTIVDPRAMVIHIQNTYVTNRAMMTSLRLKSIAY